MARVKKQLVELLSTLSSKEIQKLQAKLLAPKVASLRREREKLQKRLREIERQLARVAKAKPRRRRVRRVRKARAKRAPVKRVKRRARKGTIASRIEGILKRAPAPMRVKDICDALARAGVPKKKGLVNYVNRILSTNPAFSKAGWGVYSLAGKPSAAPAKKAARKKAARRKVARKKANPAKKAAPAKK